MLTTPELVSHILQSLKENNPKEACNAAQSWCNTTKGNKVMCSDENDFGWSVLTEKVFEDYAAPPAFADNVHRPPEGYTRKGWFQELCRRHGRVLGQIKRSNYYTSRFYNTENQIQQLRHQIQTCGMQAEDVSSMEQELRRLNDILDDQKKENELQDTLWDAMHKTFFSNDGHYFDDAIFAGEPYEGLNKLDADVFKRKR